MITDVKYALRTIRKNPGFAIGAVFTLAIGLGANAAIFSVVHAVLLRPLDYTEADRIVALGTTWRGRPENIGPLSAPDYHDWKRQSTAFESMAYFQGGEMGVKAGEQAEFTGIFFVTPEFFHVMREKPLVGRLFSPDEQKPNGAGGAIVSATFARSHYGSPDAALGRTLGVLAKQLPIVGVLRDGFNYPIRGTTRADVWVPAGQVVENTHRTGHNYRAVARLRTGVTLEQAKTEMTVIGTRLAAAHPKDNTGKDIAVWRLQDSLTRQSQATLWMLMGAVGLLLLLACANVGNMLLARATSRTREMALRAAIGASRWAIVRQLLIESSLLACLAGIAGFAVAVYVTEALLALAPVNLPRAHAIAVDGNVAVFLALVCMLAVFVFGLAPALQASRVDLNEALKQGGQRGLLGGRTGKLRNALVVAEIAMSFVLIIGAGLLFRSFIAMTEADMGFRPERLLAMSTSVPTKDLKAAKDAPEYFTRLTQELRTIPGVKAAAAVMGLPTGKRGSNGAYELEGRPAASSLAAMPNAGFRVITPGYFETMATPMLRGRDFENRDTNDSPLVAIVNRAFVQREFPNNEDPIGKRVRCGLDRPEWMTIVGVVGDVRHNSPAEAAGAEIYMPAPQHPFVSDEMHVVVRAEADVAGIAGEMRKRAAVLNADVSTSVTTMNQMMADAVATPKFRSVLLGVFAAIAMLLAMAGVYGVMAFVVTQRTSELGLRVALGASTRDVISLVLGRALTMAVAGLAIGAGLSVALTRALQGMLYGVQATDVATYGSAVLVVGAVAVLAAALPASRAARVNPVEALRAE